MASDIAIELHKIAFVLAILTPAVVGWVVFDVIYRSFNLPRNK